MPNTCTYCNNEQALKGYNTISDIYLELCDYWSSKNLLKSDEVTFCSFKKTAKGYNDLETTHEYLLNEWDYLNNILLAKPTEIDEKSNKIVWWICKDDPNHRYKFKINEKIKYEKRNLITCKICKGLRRKQEHFVQFAN